jgi:hypothetical protein
MLNEWCMSAFGPRDTDMQVSPPVALLKYQHYTPTQGPRKSKNHLSIGKGVRMSSVFLAHERLPVLVKFLSLF